MFSTLHQIEKAHADSIWTVDWLNNTQLLTGSVDHEVYLWDAATQQKVSSLMTHPLGITTLSCDKNRILTASLDGVWRLFDASNMQLLKSLACPSFTAKLSGDKIYCGGQDGNIYIYDVSSGNLITKLETNGKFLYSLDVKDSRIISGHENGHIYIYGYEDHKFVNKIDGHIKAVRSISISENGLYFVSGGMDDNLHLYDAKCPSFISSLSGHASWIMNTRISSANPNLCVSSSMDSRVKLWDLVKKQCLYTFTAHTNGVYSAAFNPRGDRIASVGDDKSIYIHSCTP